MATNHLFFALIATILMAGTAARTVTMRLFSAVDGDTLHDELMRRSTPGDSMFRQHMTLDELTTLTSSTQHCIDHVTDWLLLRVGATNVRLGVTRDHIFATVPSKHTLRAAFAHEDRPGVRGRQSMEVPQELRSCVRYSFVGPEQRAAVGNDDNNHRRSMRPSRQTGGAAADHVHRTSATILASSSSSSSSSGSSGFPGMNQNPKTVAQRYSVPLVSVGHATNFSQGVAEFEGEQFYQTDVNTFNAKFGVADNTIRVSGPNKGGYFDEGIMDLEIIQTIATDAETWWIADKEEDFTQWTDQVMQLSPMPLVLSISWGSGESGYDNSSMSSDSEEFRKLGLLGASVFAASGDQGTGNTGFLTCGIFDPTFPATSPYVTAVGGTYANSLAADEISWSGSGGGFSTVFPAPTYQTEAIRHYTTTTVMPPAQYYRAGGRGIPDVSALSCNFDVYASGWGTETGTSAATPTFAGIISRINVVRMASGKSSLGFLNPALYQLGKVGFDVVEGNNQVLFCPAGFNATVGWDAISGLGTPNFQELLSALS